MFLIFFLLVVAVSLVILVSILAKKKWKKHKTKIELEFKEIYRYEKKLLIPNVLSTRKAVLQSHPGEVVKNSFLVVYKDTVSSAAALTSCIVTAFASDGSSPFRVTNEYQDCVRGFAAIMEDAVLNDLLQNPNVENIYEDAVVKLEFSTDHKTSENKWFLNRIFKPNLPEYKSQHLVDVFILDSGIDPTSIPKPLVSYEKSFVSDFANDDNGHGTHVAGIIKYVAPNASLHAIKVITEKGSGSYSKIVAAINYVVGLKTGTRKVANLSLGNNIRTTNYNILDLSVSQAISSGVVFCVAGGNVSENSEYFSPAHVRTAITVGSFGQDNKFSEFSNFGSSLTILAPGSDIVSKGLNNTTKCMTGTSMSCPFISGFVARYLSLNPISTPAQVKAFLILKAKEAVLKKETTLIENVPPKTCAESIWVDF